MIRTEACRSVSVKGLLEIPIKDYKDCVNPDGLDINGYGKELCTDI